MTIVIWYPGLVHDRVVKVLTRNRTFLAHLYSPRLGVSSNCAQNCTIPSPGFPEEKRVGSGEDSALFSAKKLWKKRYF